MWNVEFSPDGTMLASGGSRQYPVRLWKIDRSTGRLIDNGVS